MRRRPSELRPGMMFVCDFESDDHSPPRTTLVLSVVKTDFGDYQITFLDFMHNDKVASIEIEHHEDEIHLFHEQWTEIS